MKRYIIWGITGIAIILFLSWLWNFWHSGTIIVTTNNPDYTIKLVKKMSSKDREKGEQPKIYTAHSKLSVNVHTGEYIASVESGAPATAQSIKFSSHKTLKYDLNPASTFGAETVIYQSAQSQSVAVNGKQLFYLENGSGYLHKIDSQNDDIAINSTLHFQSIKWADSAYGLGQDDSGRLYLIDNGSIKAITLSSDSQKVTAYSISSNKQVYALIGDSLYSGTSPSFKKIYTTAVPSPNLAAFPDGVAIFSTQNQAGEIGGKKAKKPITEIVSSSGKRLAKRGLDALNAAWSPSGKYLAVTNAGGADVYDQTLKPIGFLPSNLLINSVYWADDNKLLFSVNDKLWSYIPDSQKAEIIAGMPLAAGISSITASGDKSYVYLTTLDSSDIAAIRRVSLNGQKIPDYIFQLQNIMPLNADAYSLSVINFAQPPTIVIQSNTKTPSDVYRQSAQDMLKQRNFDISNLRFRAAPIIPGQ